MRDLRCWQSEASSYYVRPASPAQLRSVALELAAGEPDFDRLWSRDVERPVALGFNVPGVREQFVDVLRSSPSLREGWVPHLLQRVQGGLAEVSAGESSPRRSMRFGREDLEELLGGWAAERRPTAAWDHPSRQLDYLPDVAGLGAANLLMQVDPASACKAFESLVLPTFVQQAMQWGYQVSEDRDLLFDVLQLAAPVFDADAWTHNIVALLALELVVDHANKLDHAVRMLEHQSPWSRDMPEPNQAAHAAALERLRDDELPTWFRAAFDHVLTRPDGRTMLLYFHPVLSSRLLYARQLGGSPQWDANAAAARVLSQVLRDAHVTTAERRAVWLTDATNADPLDETTTTSKGRDVPDGEGARSLRHNSVAHLMAALSTAADDASTGELAELWCWFEAVLRGRAPDLEQLERASGAEAFCRQLGTTLAALPAPTDSFETSYRRLEPQRRRAERGIRYGEYMRNCESSWLLRVGLFAAASMVQTAFRREEANALFRQVYRHARRLWLTKGGGDNSEPESLVAVCFAFVPAVFGDAARDVLPSLVAPIATDSSVTLSAASYLRVNHMPVDAIVALFERGGADLVAMAREESEWWSQAKTRPQWFEALAPLLRSLAPGETARRQEAIAARARARSEDPELRGASALDDWLAAEHELAVVELRAAGATTVDEASDG